MFYKGFYTNNKYYSYISNKLIKGTDNLKKLFLKLKQFLKIDKTYFWCDLFRIFALVILHTLVIAIYFIIFWYEKFSFQ